MKTIPLINNIVPCHWRYNLKYEKLKLSLILHTIFKHFEINAHSHKNEKD